MTSPLGSFLDNLRGGFQEGYQFRTGIEDRKRRIASEEDAATYEQARRLREAVAFQLQQRVGEAQLERYQRSERTPPLTLSPGATVYDPATQQPVYTAPDKPAKTAEPEHVTIGRRMYERPPGGTWRVAITAPDEAGSGLKPKQPPASIVNAKADNNSTIHSIDEAISAVEKNPGVVGPSLYNYAPEWVKKPFNTPERAMVQAPVADVASLTVKLRSGATVTVAEEPRLAPFIPDIRDKPSVILVKLKRMRRKLEEINAELEGAYQGGAPSGGGAGITADERAALKTQGYSDEEIDAIP